MTDAEILALALDAALATVEERLPGESNADNRARVLGALAVPLVEQLGGASGGMALAPSAPVGDVAVFDEAGQVVAGGPPGTPGAHASTHATAGGDALTPAAIGAAEASHTHTGVYQPAGSYAASSHGHGAGEISGLGGAAVLAVGTTTGTVAAGDDGRFTDARTPTTHSHAQSESHGTPDTDTATTALHHTLGTGANQAAAGNHTHPGGSGLTAAKVAARAVGGL